MAKSRYSNVYIPNPRHFTKKKQWRARIQINGVSYDAFYMTEQEAAKAIDKLLTDHGKKPRNFILLNF